MSQSRHAVLQLNTALQQQHAASLLQQHLKTRFFVLQREFSKSLGPQRDIDVNFLWPQAVCRVHPGRVYSAPYTFQYSVSANDVSCGSNRNTSEP